MSDITVNILGVLTCIGVATLIVCLVKVTWWD